MIFSLFCPSEAAISETRAVQPLARGEMHERFMAHVHVIQLVSCLFKKTTV